MSKKSELLYSFIPKIKTPEEIEKEKRDFFRNCERIVAAPACIFLEGNRFSLKAKLLSLPFYAYAGIEKSNYDRFMYEEYEWGEREPYYARKLEIKQRLPKEEKIMLKTNTPISSIQDDRFFNYQTYLNEEVKKFLIGKQEFEKAIKNGKALEILESKKGIDFKDKATNFKDYFKIRLWSDIPSHIGLNEGAAIATAVSFLLVLEFLSTEESRTKSLQSFYDLKMKRPEELVVDWLFMEIFIKALQLDFFSNGAAIFASIMGNIRKQEAIDYECLFYNEIKRFFEPHPEISYKNYKDAKARMQAFEEVCKVKGISAYFNECNNLSKKTLDAIPLFNWSYSKLPLKDNQEIAMAVMKRNLINHEDKDFKPTLNAGVELCLLSPAAFAAFGEPSVMALAEKRPEKYIFGKEKDEVYSNYSAIYSSRTKGWEVEGVKVTEVKKPIDIREEKRIASNKLLIDKYDNIIKKWLKNDEEIQYEFCGKSKPYVSINIKQKIASLGKELPGGTRIIFAKVSDSKIEYLYDSDSLRKDWDVKKLRFKTYDAKDINIYLHLAISFLTDFSLIDAEDALREFIKLNPDTKGNNCAKTVVEFSELFPMAIFGFSLFGFVYTRLHMVSEAGIAYEVMGTYDNCVSNIGYGLILQSKYDEAVNILSREYDRLESKLENELKNSKKDVFSFPHSLTKSILDNIGGHYFWAGGMKFWSREKWKEAEKSFNTAYDFFKERETAKAKLMAHLSEIVRYRNKILDMTSQLSLIDKYGEKKKEVIKPETPTAASLGREDVETILQSVKDVKEELSRIGLAVEKDKARIKKEGRKVEIKFSDSEVRVSGRNPLSKNNPLILAEYIILKQKVHWIWAFVILPEFETKKPKWQFRNYISKEKALLRQHGIKIVALKKAEDDYAKFEGIENGIISNIEDIKTSYNKAIAIFNKGKTKEAISELTKITVSDYRWYSFTEAYLRLIELMRVINFDGIPDKLIMQCRDFLVWYRKRLQIGIGRIEFYKSQLLKSKNKLDKLADDEFQQIKEELKVVEENLEALIKKIPLSKEELDYETLVGFLIDLKGKLKYIWEDEMVKEEARQETSLELIRRSQDSNAYFRDIVNNAFSVMSDELYKLNKSKTYSDKSLQEESREVYWFIRDLIIELESFDDFELKDGSRLGMLTNYFNAGLENRIKKWLRGQT
jgi:hypothetical protein